MRPTRVAGKILKFFHSARWIWGTQHPQTPDCGGDHHCFGNHWRSIHQLRCDRARRARLRVFIGAPDSHGVHSPVLKRSYSAARQAGQRAGPLIDSAPRSSPWQPRFPCRWDSTLDRPVCGTPKDAASGPQALCLRSQTFALPNEVRCQHARTIRYPLAIPGFGTHSSRRIPMLSLAT